MNFTLLVICVFTFIAALITGSILLPFAYSVPGIHARIRGICAVHEDRRVVSSSDRGASGSRAVWSVAVYKYENSTNPPLYDDVAAFIGDLSSTEQYKRNVSAFEDLELFPFGELAPCVYPSNPLHYPSGGSRFNTRAVFLGNYTQGQVDKGYKRAHAMLIPGILLLVADGACLIVIFMWCIFKYCKSSENVTLI